MLHRLYIRGQRKNDDDKRRQICISAARDVVLLVLITFKTISFCVVMGQGCQIRVLDSNLFFFWVWVKSAFEILLGFGSGWSQSLESTRVLPNYPAHHYSLTLCVFPRIKWVPIAVLRIRLRRSSEERKFSHSSNERSFAHSRHSLCRRRIPAEIWANS